MTQLEEIIHHECPSLGTPKAVLQALVTSPRPSNGDKRSCWEQAMPGIPEPSLADIARSLSGVTEHRDRIEFLDSIQTTVLPRARLQGRSKAQIKAEIATL